MQKQDVIYKPDMCTSDPYSKEKYSPQEISQYDLTQRLKKLNKRVMYLEYAICILRVDFDILKKNNHGK
jgi:hypothetical protein